MHKIGDDNRLHECVHDHPYLDDYKKCSAARASHEGYILAFADAKWKNKVDQVQAELKAAKSEIASMKKKLAGLISAATAVASIK